MASFVGSVELKLAVRYLLQFSRGDAIGWKTMLAYITGSVDQELLLRNDYLTVKLPARSPNLNPSRSAG